MKSAILETRNHNGKVQIPVAIGTGVLNPTTSRKQDRRQQAENDTNPKIAGFFRRIVPNIYSNDIDKTKKFYMEFLEMNLVMDMGWILTFASK